MAARVGKSKAMLNSFTARRFLSPEDGHRAVIRLTKAICFLPDVHTFEVVVLQQMIAAVFEFVDSIEFKVAEWAHPGLV